MAIHSYARKLRCCSVVHTYSRCLGLVIDWVGIMGGGEGGAGCKNDGSQMKHRISSCYESDITEIRIFVTVF